MPDLRNIPAFRGRILKMPATACFTVKISSYYNRNDRPPETLGKRTEDTEAVALNKSAETVCEGETDQGCSVMRRSGIIFLLPRKGVSGPPAAVATAYLTGHRPPARLNMPPERITGRAI